MAQQLFFVIKKSRPKRRQDAESSCQTSKSPSCGGGGQNRRFRRRRSTLLRLPIPQAEEFRSIFLWVGCILAIVVAIVAHWWLRWNPFRSSKHHHHHHSSSSNSSKDHHHHHHSHHPLLADNNSSDDHHNNDDERKSIPTCAYIPGAGFSGFPFAIGSIQSLPDPTNVDYYCFSAGCLAATAALSGATAEETCDIAVNSQDLWKNGTISRFQFVDTLVDQMVTQENFGSLERLSKLHVITVIPSWKYGLETVSRTPQSIQELKWMLKQTTWIPIVTGDSLIFDDHIDGAFTSLLASGDHYCPHSVKLPFEFTWDGLEFFSNCLNMGLSREQWWKMIDLGNRYRVF